MGYFISTTENRNKVKLVEFCTYDDFANETLLGVLNFFRQINSENEIMDDTIKVRNSSDDILFNFTTYCEAKMTGKSNRHRFYEPRLLIKNKDACKLKSQDGILYIVLIVNSQFGNYARRQAMRETWMSKKHVYLNDLLHTESKHKYSSITNKKLELVHLFIVGSEAHQSNQSIIKENDKYNDMLMIDTLDTYRNVIYKHLAVINWINEYCSNSLLYMKLDDDVMLNLMPLLSHFYFKFGLEYPREKMFIYGDIKKKTQPLRKSRSKWYVNNETWSFSLYPDYFQGFGYLTSFKTVKLIYEQSKMIPRFWIDDTYFLGILLHGFVGKQVEFIDYRKNKINFRFYSLSDFNSTLLDYEIFLQNKTFKLTYKQPLNFFSDNLIVILHAQRNYRVKDFASLLVPLSKFNKSRVQNDSNIVHDLFLHDKSISFNCIFKTFSLFSDKYVNCKHLSESKLTNNSVNFVNKTSSGCTIESKIKIENCIRFHSDNLSLFNVYFYHFFVNLWQKSQYMY